MNRQSGTSTRPIIITVDLEDWFQVENLRPCFPLKSWESCESRIEMNTYRLLELFERYNVCATFFVLGWVAKRFGGLIREIAGLGHEIASHGYSHRLCCDIQGPALRGDIHMSKALLEDITGQAVLGYRAPNFSITKELAEVLGDLNFAYDSSYNNFRLNRRHGKPEDLRRTSEGYLVMGNGIMELPVSNLRFAGRTIPWAGGGYFRFWPTALFESGVARILRSEGHYVFYCHPWEVDPAQPRQTHGIGSVSRFRHYLNLDKTLEKLRHFFVRFQDSGFVSCGAYLPITQPCKPCEGDTTWDRVRA